MLAYEKKTCSTDKCRGNAYVALDLRSYKKGSSSKRIRDRLGVASIEKKACPTPVEMVWTCSTETSRGTGA